MTTAMVIGLYKIIKLKMDIVELSTIVLPISILYIAATICFYKIILE